MPDVGMAGELAVGVVMQRCMDLRCAGSVSSSPESTGNVPVMASRLSR